MCETIQQLGPDVMGTQEGIYSQVKDLASDLPEFDWIGLGREGGSSGEFMAVFYRKSRLEPLAYDHFWLSDTPEVINSATWGNKYRRMVTWVKFRDRVNGNEFFVFNTHFDHQVQLAREKSAELVRKRIDALNTDLPVLLIGDFNSAAESNKAYEILTAGKFLTDAWLAAPERRGEGSGTFNDFKAAVPNGARIDWILKRGDVTVERAEMSTFSRDGQFPSDHFPVVARLRLSSGPSLSNSSSAIPQSGMRTISREVLRDKIRGAWAGQMIGVSRGAPVEFKSLGKIIGGEIKGEPLKNAITQDDLYVEMTFASVMDTIGLNATTADYGEAFKNSKYELWHANAGARRNLNRGIAAPMSGQPRYNLHADDIDFQIEADFIGIMCPGLPQVSNQYCDRVGRVMNYGDGLYGGMFVSGMYAEAYFENDPRKVVTAGLACIPAEGSYAKLVSDLLAWSAKEPKDWRKVWQQLEDKWDKNDPCPDGAFRAFNIDAKLNGAYIALGLLYGKGDWQQTMEIAARCGQDADCNPSSAAGVLGAMIGYEKIPERHRQDLTKLADTKFSFTDYSYNDIVKSSEARTLEVIKQAGGKVSETEVVIPEQSAKAPPLEQCDFGLPTKVVWVKDAAWNWSTNWVEKIAYIWADKIDSRVADGAGFEATLRFSGTGVALVGDLTQSGGRADVFIDEAKSELVADAYIVPRTHDNDLWHVNGLKSGEHTLRLVMRDDWDERSKGKKLTISRAIIYDSKPVTQTIGVIRINAGAEADFTDADGTLWLSDRGFEGGDVTPRDADMKVENTANTTIYRTEHWGMESFSQSLPNGKYMVKLHFAETWEGIEGPGGRVFSMNVEGKKFEEFDVYAKSGGPRRAYVVLVNVHIADGKLDIAFEAGVDNPEINGIEIIPAP